jgi:predicted permease
MRRLRAVVVRILALFQRDRLDRELSEELESHLALHIDDNLRAGMSAQEARRQALARLGGVVQVQEQHRRARSLPMLDRLATDVRYSARALRAAPAFTIVAIMTLALGIGANTAIFSVINAALFQPLPVERPDELVAINSRASGAPTFSYPDYRDFRDRQTSLSALAGMRLSPMNLETAGAASRVWGFLVTGNYFEMLGVRGARGRLLTSDDDRLPGGHPVLVISDECWRTRFAADPAIVGRTVKVNGAPFTILGVTPPGFRGTERLLTPEVWIPIMMVAHIESGNDWLERRHTQNVFVQGRRAPGVSNAQAEASLNAVAAELARQYPEMHEGLRVSVSPPGLVGNMLRGPIVGFSGALLGVAGLVLLLACTNLTGLLLARSTDRRRETALRLSLGAARSDLVRRALVESALLSLAAAAAATIIAAWFGTALTAWRLPVDVPIRVQIGLDARVFLFAFGLALVSTLLIGSVPALQGTRADVMPALKDETVRWRGGWHARDIVVGLQIALSTVLLAGSLLVVRSLLDAINVDVGFNPNNAVTSRMDLGLQGYDRARAQLFQRRVIEAVAALPGIDSVAVSSSIPLNLDSSTHTVFVEGQPAKRGANVPSAIYYQVSPGFFRTLQTRLVAGRDFTDADTSEARSVAIVNQAFATQYLGPGDPVGKRFSTGSSGVTWVEVIGVVQDGKYQTLAEAPRPVAFYSVQQWHNPSTTIVARTSIGEGEAIAAIRRAVLALDPSMSLFEEASLSQQLALPLLPIRAAAVLLGAFGALALVLVLVGIYGLMSYAIAQRTREICIRLAIGASARDIVRVVFGRAAIVWVSGVTIGVVAAIAGAPLLGPILLGPPRPVPMIVAACAILAVVIIAAAWFPTRRALVADPSVLLRRA